MASDIDIVALATEAFEMDAGNGRAGRAAGTQRRRSDGARGMRWGVCVVLLLLSLGRAGQPAPSYWSVIDELGFDESQPAAVRAQAHRRLYALAQHMAWLEPGVQGTDALQQLLDIDDGRVTTLDIGELYSRLPYGPEGDEWRGVGLWGEFQAERYHVRLADPALAAWCREGGLGLPGPPSPGPAFGRIGARFFVRPVDASRHRLHAQSLMACGGMNPGRWPWMLHRMANVTEARVRQAVAAEGRGIEAVNAALVRGFVADFPHTSEFLGSFLEAEEVVTAVWPDQSIECDVRLKLDFKALKKRYPRLARLLKRSTKTFGLTYRLEDQEGRVLATAERHGADRFLRLRFRIKGGCLVPLDATGEEGTFDLLQPGDQVFTLYTTIRMRLTGIRVGVVDWPVRCRYQMSEIGPELRFVLREMPGAIDASGRFLGFVPLWLVDLVIPSNLEAMTRGFVANLVNGRDGQGVCTSSGVLKSEAGYSVWHQSDAEVRSNGMIQFSLDIANRMVGQVSLLITEARDLQRAIWGAFMADFSYFTERAPGGPDG